MSCSAMLREPYIDRSRVAAFGKEYGGYVTSLLLSTKDSPVNCAAVLSPITDFELYGELGRIAQRSPRRAESTNAPRSAGSVERANRKRKDSVWKLSSKIVQEAAERSRSWVSGSDWFPLSSVCLLWLGQWQ